MHTVTVERLQSRAKTNGNVSETVKLKETQKVHTRKALTRHQNK